MYGPYTENKWPLGVKKWPLVVKKWPLVEVGLYLPPSNGSISIFIVHKTCYSFQINQSVSIENNKDKTEKDILTGLKDLLNLTTPNETYAILAGDLVTSTEILKLVVDYTTRASEDSVRTIEEVKVKKSSLLLLAVIK